MRDTLPKMNSSSIRSPITSTRRPEKRPIASTDIPRGFGTEGDDVGAAGGRLARDGHEREAGPRNHRVQPAQEPHRFIENLQYRFADAPCTEDSAVRPPRQERRLIEAIHAIYGEL